MSSLLIFLLFAVLQVAVYYYARNIVAASVADAARYAASAGTDPGAGGARANRLIRERLGRADAAAVPCTGRPGVDEASGLSVVTVRCHGRLQALFLPLHLPLTIDVSSSVLREGGS